MKRAYKKKYHFIYKTTCLVTNKYYYGMHSTDDLEDGYLGSGKYLWRSLNKHGKDNHKIERLEFFNTREKLRKREEEIINEDLLNDPFCMNLTIGGRGFYDEKHMMKCSLAGAKKGGESAGKIIGERMKDPNYQIDKKKKFSDAGHEWWIGKHHTLESKKKMSLSQQGKQKGEKNSQFGKCWITNGKENKKINKGDNIPNGWKLGRKIK